MAKVFLQYMGKKKALRLRLSFLKEGYDFLPENGMVCSVDADDAQRLQEENQRMFIRVNGYPKAVESPLVTIEESAEVVAKAEQGDGEEGSFAKPEPSGQIDPAVVEKAKAEMEAAGVKLGNISKDETIMKRYAEFVKTKAT